MLPCAELWARQLSPAYRKSQKRNSAENDLPTTPPPAGGAKDPTHRETQRAPLQTTACWGWIHLFNTVNSRRISSSVLFGFFSGGDLKRERLMREATTPASVLGPGAATDTHPTCLPPPSLQTLCPQPVLHWPALLGCWQHRHFPLDQSGQGPLVTMTFPGCGAATFTLKIGQMVPKSTTWVPNVYLAAPME